MRFVSHIRKFGVQVVEPRVRYTNYGDRIEEREMYVAQFSQDDVTDKDVEFARRVFEDGGFMHGRTTMLDEVTLSPIRNRLSVFDTDEHALAEDWDPAFKQHVEEFLTTRSIDHPDFRLIELEPVPPPWPRYMDFRGTLDELVAKLIDDGYDLATALEFERTRGHRQMVIDALEAKIAEVSQTVPEENQPASVPA